MRASRFFTADFYEGNPVERVATADEYDADAASDAAPAAGAPRPGLPARIAVRATTDSLVYVSWDPPAAGAMPTGYAVVILQNNRPSPVADSSDCAELGPERVSCVIANAAPGRSHKVSVAARSAAGIGPALETKAFSVPEAVDWRRFFTDAKWRTLLVPRSYGIWPLLVGTMMIAALAMLVAVPLGLLSAIFLSEYAPPRLRAVTKPILEVLAGIPTVVYGFFALFFVTRLLRLASDEVGIFNALSAAIVYGRDDYSDGVQPQRGCAARGAEFAARRRLCLGRYQTGSGPESGNPGGPVRHRGGVHTGNVARRRRNYDCIHRRRARTKSLLSTPWSRSTR